MSGVWWAAALLVESVPYQRLTPGYTQARTTQPLPCRVVCAVVVCPNSAGGERRRLTDK
jgi:hypothetical protein